MELGLHTDSVGHVSRRETLDLAAENGLSHVEFATGGWSSAPHLHLDELLGDRGAREQLRQELDARGLRISALNCSGNPLHPGDSGVAHDSVVRRTIRLAAELGVERLVLMSGLPAAPGDSQPNWVVVSWPPEATELLQWQWHDVVLPYWNDLTEYARSYGIHQLCLEMHAQQVVYNVPTLHYLRDQVGPIIGANFDPSHLMWMGADPIAAARSLGEAVYHVHAKDTRLEQNQQVRTSLETLPLFRSAPDQRAWNYVTLGAGNGVDFWRDFVGALDEIGYSGVLSIEHEDAEVPPEEGVRRSIALLRDTVTPV